MPRARYYEERDPEVDGCLSCTAIFTVIAVFGFGVIFFWATVRTAPFDISGSVYKDLDNQCCVDPNPPPSGINATFVSCQYGRDHLDATALSAGPAFIMHATGCLLCLVAIAALIAAAVYSGNAYRKTSAFRLFLLGGALVMLIALIAIVSGVIFLNSRFGVNWDQACQLNTLAPGTTEAPFSARSEVAWLWWAAIVLGVLVILNYVILALRCLSPDTCDRHEPIQICKTVDPYRHFACNRGDDSDDDGYPNASFAAAAGEKEERNFTL